MSLFLTCLGLWVVCVFNRSHLPAQEDLQKPLFSQPSPTPTKKEPFDVTKNGITYNIQPLYNYELYGLIVSHHNASSLDDYYHEEWKDYINTKDICVVFSDNIRTDIYKQVKFSSGSWTCYYRWANNEERALFKPESMSNNHLLTDDPEISKKVSDASDGDQVYLKGYLVKYGKGIEPKRGYDTFTLGKGECQVIFLTDFQILSNNPWKLPCFILKWLTILLGCGALIKRFFLDRVI